MTLENFVFNPGKSVNNIQYLASSPANQGFNGTRISQDFTEMHNRSIVFSTPEHSEVAIATARSLTPDNLTLPRHILPDIDLLSLERLGLFSKVMRD